MPFIPLLVWFTRGSPWRATVIPPFFACSLMVPGPLMWLSFFMAGASLSRFDLKCPALETVVPQWLGRVSYSLYIIHVPTLMALLVLAGPEAVLPGLPAVFASAWVVWRFVEEPSIRWSRLAAAL